MTQVLNCKMQFECILCCAKGTIYELEVVKTEIRSMLKHLREWSADEKLPLNALAILDRGYIRREPYGVVLVLGAWNYPFTLTCKPLVGAIAAGNTVVIKPSEVSGECARTMGRLFPKYLDPVSWREITSCILHSMIFSNH